MRWHRLGVAIGFMLMRCTLLVDTSNLASSRPGQPVADEDGITTGDAPTPWLP